MQMGIGGADGFFRQGLACGGDPVGHGWRADNAIAIGSGGTPGIDRGVDPCAGCDHEGVEVGVDGIDSADDADPDGGQLRGGEVEGLDLGHAIDGTRGGGHVEFVAAGEVGLHSGFGSNHRVGEPITQC